MQNDNASEDSDYHGYGGVNDSDDCGEEKEKISPTFLFRTEEFPPLRETTATDWISHDTSEDCSELDFVPSAIDENILANFSPYKQALLSGLQKRCCSPDQLGTEEQPLEVIGPKKNLYVTPSLRSGDGKSGA